MKRWLICLFMLVAVLVLAAPARAEEFSGTCGEGLTWSFDQSTGTLTISGEGAMEDYSSSATSENQAPWHACREDITSVVIEPGITGIGSYAFLEYPKLLSVSMPDTVQCVGSGAFLKCVNLEQITLPEGVESIGDFAFKDCVSLMNFRFPASVSNIGRYAFEDCHKLLNVVFYGSVPEFGSFAFAGDSLTVYYPAGNAAWENYASKYFASHFVCYGVEDPASVKLPGKGDVLEGKCGPDAIWRLENGTLTITGTGSIDIAKWSGYASLIDKAVVSDGITNLPSAAFAQTNIKQIELPDSLESIDGAAFRWCYNLQEIEIPAGVTFIGELAFNDCTGLKRVVLPAGLTHIRYNVFHGCTALSDLVLPENLERIFDRAFYNCESLTEITFPETLDYLDAEAFVGCKSLKRVVFLGWAPQMSRNAFSGLTCNIHYPVGDETWTSKVMDNMKGDLTRIEGTGETSGSCGAGLTWKLVGDTLTISGTGRMSNYTLDALPQWSAYNAQIKKVVIEEGVTSVGTFAFYLMSGIKTLEFPDGLLEIAGEAFAGCGGIEELHIPDSVTRIGNYCFSGLIYLRELTLGEGLETIGDDAFYDCMWLTEVTFPATLKSVGRYAFAMCTRLKTATFLGPAPTIAPDAFELADVTVYYPAREESWNEGIKNSLWYVKEYVAACIPEHTMGQWEVTKEPTVDLYGEEMRKCIYCDEFEVRDVPKLQPEEPDPTQPTQPQATEPTQPNVTEPNATEPTQADSPDEKRDKPALNGLAIAVIAASVLAAAGAVALAVHTKRSE